MTLEELFNEDILNESKERKFKKAMEAKSKETRKSHGVKDLKGRRALATLFIKRMHHHGVQLSRAQAMAFLDKKYLDWKENKDKHISKYEGRAKGLGFNPHDYMNQRPGQSAGKTNEGQPEYIGRGYFFTRLMDHYVDEYLADHNMPNKDRE